MQLSAEKKTTILSASEQTFGPSYFHKFNEVLDILRSPRNWRIMRSRKSKPRYGVLHREPLILQTSYVLNKEILQVIGLKPAVYNQDQSGLKIKSRLYCCVYAIYMDYSNNQA